MHHSVSSDEILTRCLLGSVDSSIILVYFDSNSGLPIFIEGAPHYLKSDSAPAELNGRIFCFCECIDHSDSRLDQRLLADLGLN